LASLDKYGPKDSNVVYQGTEYRLLEKDYDTMPTVLTESLMANKAEYKHAPNRYSHPNETIRTYYKKMNPK